MRRACKNGRKLKILNGHEKVQEGTSRGDTTTNLRNFSSRFFVVPTENLENLDLEAPGPKTRQISCQETMVTFVEITKFMNIGRNWTHIRRIGLRIKPFESQGCYQSNGNPPDPQNCHRKFKIDQKSNGPHRPHCPLNLAINRRK